jgi:hypothetical protein
MAMQHGGEIYDFENMTDSEIRDVVVEHLREHPALDADWIEVDVRNGAVTLSGRVGTDGEVNTAEAVLDDVLGIENYSNELVVDELHRGEAPEGADDAAVQAEEVDPAGGRGAEQQSDTADHLQEDLEEQAFGTHDVNAAIRDGSAYIPPDDATADGYDSREDH